MEFIVLSYPYLILLMGMGVIITACLKKWRLSLLLFVLAYLFNLYSETFALLPNVNQTADSGGIKVLSFNMNATGDDYCKRYEDIVTLLVAMSNDIVLLNENSTPYDDYDLKFDSLISRHYPYTSKKYFSRDDNVYLSKYPIVGYDSIKIDNKVYLPLIKVEVQQKILYVVGCHFCSNNYVDSIHRIEIDSVKSKTDLVSYIKAIEKGYKKRKEQVDELCQNLQSSYSPYLKNMIIMGDFNDVGGSYTVNKLEELGLKDAWWEGGLGFGGTRDTGIFRNS